MADPYQNVADRTNPADRHFLVVPSDSVDFAIKPRAIYCQAAGTAMVVDAGNTPLPYDMTAGQTLPIRAVRIDATGTTGTFYGLY